MEPELLERAQKVAELANGSKLTESDFKEIGAIYSLLTGKTARCISCNVYSLLNEIRSKVIQQPKEHNPMAKYQFKHNAASREVIRHTEAGTRVITSENLNKSDNAEFMLKQYPHLIEETKASKAESEESEGEKLTAKQQLQARYQELIGEAPEDSLTKADLKAKIEAAEAGKETE